MHVCTRNMCTAQHHAQQVRKQYALENPHNTACLHVLHALHALIALLMQYMPAACVGVICIYCCACAGTHMYIWSSATHESAHMAHTPAVQCTYVLMCLHTMCSSMFVLD